MEPQKFANKDYAVASGAAYYANELEVSPSYRYRRALEISWADEKLNREEVEHLSNLLPKLGLGTNEAAEEIEREALDATIEEIVDRQREE